MTLPLIHCRDNLDAARTQEIPRRPGRRPRHRPRRPARLPDAQRLAHLRPHPSPTLRRPRASPARRPRRLAGQSRSLGPRRIHDRPPGIKLRPLVAICGEAPIRRRALPLCCSLRSSALPHTIPTIGKSLPKRPKLCFHWDLPVSTSGWGLTRWPTITIRSLTNSHPPSISPRRRSISNRNRLRFATPSRARSGVEQAFSWLNKLVPIALLIAAGTWFCFNRANINTSRLRQRTSSPIDIVLWLCGSKHTFREGIIEATSKPIPELENMKAANSHRQLRPRRLQQPHQLAGLATEQLAFFGNFEPTTALTHAALFAKIEMSCERMEYSPEDDSPRLNDQAVPVAVRCFAPRICTQDEKPRRARGFLSFAFGYLGKGRLESIARPGVAIWVMARMRAGKLDSWCKTRVFSEISSGFATKRCALP